MFHISDIKKFSHCERLYALSKDKDNNFQPYLRSDEPINELLIKYLNIDDCYIGERNDTLDRFLTNIDNYEWFCHPRLVEDELRVNVPFLHKVNNKFDVYFVYYGSIIKDLDLITYSISIKVLKNLGFDVNNIYVIYFNPDYVRDSVIEPSKLFLTIDCYKEEKIINLVCNYQFDYKNIINKIKEYDVETSNYKKNKYCRQMGICDYYDICFPNENDFSDDCILTLVSCKNKNDMYDNGIYLLKDADVNSIDGNRVQYAQIMASKNNGLFVDKNALSYWLKQFENSRLSFIDFEWDRYLVPPYSNMRPMDVLCFEFALYYYNDNCELMHETYVGTKDCREEFIKKLLEFLPTDGPIFAYNSDGAEKIRILELARMFPKYETELKKIADRFVDLATPFIEGIVYDVRMKGNYTLKKLVDIISDYSYSNLDINDGMSAVYNWRNIDKDSDDTKTIENLKQYCSLDAYGLILVYNWLHNLINESK